MQKAIQIGILLERADESSRTKIGGIFRFAGEHPDWDLHVFSPVQANTARLRRMDGLIAGDAPLPPNIYRTVPTVLIDDPHAAKAPSAATIFCDNASVGTIAAKLLMRCGYRSLAFAGTSAGTDAFHSSARKKAFVAAAADFGIHCSVFVDPVFTVLSHQSNEAQLNRFLQKLTKPCGVMAYCDAFARLVLRLAQNTGISIPDEIGVIGVDNDPMIVENTHPRLSSIAIDLDSAGYKAAQMLAQMIAGKMNKEKFTPPLEHYGITAVAERESTPVSIVTDRRVGKALAFMRDHFREHIGVSDVAKAVGIGIRTLELVFRKIRRRTVHEEIINMRLAEIRRLLLDTNERITDITYECGFGTPNNLKMLFRKRFGMSMRTYRNQREYHYHEL